jgi:hypothetical protein
LLAKDAKQIRPSSIASDCLDIVDAGRYCLDHAASTLHLVTAVAYLLGIPLPKSLDGNNPLGDLQDKPSRFKEMAPDDPDIGVPQ